MIQRVAALLFATLLGLQALATALPEKHPLDKTEYARLVLPNGLKVILVSDPKLDKAAASMAVGVGSLSDPKERPGLAHFLEHMLFLGTEKYPDVADYSNYLSSHGGYSNAYTAGDHTNYHFEVFPFAFEGALDRFAQFFIAPLFSQDFAEREMNAVHSEHQKNLENDGWRIFQLWRNHYNPNHPENHFATGSGETLTGIQREEFLTFYNKHYSANQMALSLVAPNSLQEMQSWVTTLFGGIRNHERDRVKYPSNFILPSNRFRLIEAVPIKDLREMSIVFPMPAATDRFAGKSDELISYMLGYEGKGSLLSYLKARNWATALSAGLRQDTPDYGSLSITIELTPDGLEAHREIIAALFAYVDLMQHAPFPFALFSERQTMARLEELFGNKGEGAGRAVTLANQVLRFPLDIAERIPFLWLEPDESGYFDLLSRITPEHMMVSITARAVEADQQESIYGTSYRYTETDDGFIEALRAPSTFTDLQLPQPNPFVPAEVTLLSERPLLLAAEPGLTLYYSQDLEFRHPKVAIQFKIRHPQSFVNADNHVRKVLYTEVVKEALNEFAYPAQMAGLGYSIASGIEGLYLTIDGYSESALALLEAVLDEMKAVRLSESRFSAIKDAMVRELENFPKGDAWKIAREAKREMLYEVFLTPEQQLAVLKLLNLEDIREFPDRLFASGHIEALVHGNLTQKDAAAAARKIKHTLAMKPIEPSSVFTNKILDQPEADLAIRHLSLMGNNSCYWSEYTLGEDSPEVRAASLILGNFLEEPFYTEMRTNQQLGYIVSAFTTREKYLHGLYFVVQSAQFPAEAIRERAEAYLGIVPEAFAKIDEPTFERLRQAAIATVEVKPKTIGEKASSFFELAYDLEGDFERREATLDALKLVSISQVQDLLERALSPTHARRRMILAFARDHGIPEADQTLIQDLDAWKKLQAFR